MGDAPTSKMMRPNDIFTAAYYGDVKKLKEILAIEPVEEEPPFDQEFDPLAAPDEEAEQAAKDRQQKREENAAELKRRLSQTGTIVTRLSVVNKQVYGFDMKIHEDGGDLRCRVEFKASKHSSWEATPLHWAVLGREHEAVRYLCSQGADYNATTPNLKVTPRDVAAANKSFETAAALSEGLDAFRQKRETERAAKDAFDAEVNRRAQARKDALAEEERKRLEEEERERKEEEDRLAAEAAEAEGTGGGGDGAADDGEDA